MEQTIPTKKLIVTSIYAAFFIGALAIGMHSIMGDVSSGWLFKLSLFIALMVFLISGINITIVNALSKKGIKVNGYKRYFFSYLIGIALILFFNFIFLHQTNGVAFEHTHSFQVGSLNGFHARPVALLILFISLNSIILLMHDLVLLRDRKSKIEIENAELQYKNIESTHQLLKNQIHPHFLFNSLSTLKSLIKKQPEMAEQYVVKLSDYLRSSMQTNSPKLISLKDELKLCSDYVDLQKMRFNDSFQFLNTINIEVNDSVFVPPFSLLTLLENAIKHNKFTNETPLRIILEINGDKLIMKNNKNLKDQIEYSTGLGLKNLNSRYKLLSDQEILVQEEKEFFIVSIPTLTK